MIESAVPFPATKGLSYDPKTTCLRASGWSKPARLAGRGLGNVRFVPAHVRWTASAGAGAFGADTGRRRQVVYRSLLLGRDEPSRNLGSQAHRATRNPWRLSSD